VKRKSLFWLRFTSTVIDLSIIYSISILLQALIWKFTFVGFGDIFVSTFLVYYFSFYFFFKGVTLAKLLTGIEIINTNISNVQFRNLLLREFVLKVLAGIILPAYLLQYIFPIWSPLITIAAELIVLLLSLILLLIFKRGWWELLSKTQTIKSPLSRRSSRINSFVLITCIIGAALVTILHPVYPFSKDKIRQALHTFYDKYPVTKETTEYAEFVKEHSRDPVDYVFDLFRKYDIVVLSERYHPEYTQFDLFSKIISDERFNKTIGNIFTESGSVSFQDTLNTYLQTSFADEDELNKSTANLQRNSDGVHPIWTCTNHFDFLKTVHRLNSLLPDSNKINWYFSDLPVDWETMTHENYLKGYNPIKRDSIMAAQIIHKYKDVILNQRRKKALVIMNTSHGYGLLNQKSKTGIKWLDLSTTNYLMKNFPGKVANIMIHSVSIMLTPLQQGKWETAFRLSGNRPAGFNFEGSPFGNDKWDGFFLNSQSLTYKDIFTGIIFYKPLEEQIKKDGYPHELDTFEDTLVRRAACVGSSEEEMYKRYINNYKRNPQSIFVTEPAPYALVHNGIKLLLFPALILTGYLFSLVFFVCKLRK